MLTQTSRPGLQTRTGRRTRRILETRASGADTRILIDGEIGDDQAELDSEQEADIDAQIDAALDQAFPD